MKKIAKAQVNPVAKFMHKANKSLVFKDRTKYQRAQKHKGGRYE